MTIDTHNRAESIFGNLAPAIEPFRLNLREAHANSLFEFWTGLVHRISSGLTQRRSVAGAGATDTPLQKRQLAASVATYGSPLFIQNT
jgi:hypothetical protein